MNRIDHIEKVYDLAAETYSEKFFDELSKKPLDSILLSAFAAKNKDKEIIDLGCGPGQTTRFLYDLGAKNIIGSDLSPRMVEKAKILSPGLFFERANMLSLPYEDLSFSAALAFYSIVHFSDDELVKAFSETHRVLQKGSDFLLSFHVGSTNINSENFLGSGRALEFRFFETDRVVKLLRDTGFMAQSILERWPYENVEYPSRRAYIWCHSL